MRSAGSPTSTPAAAVSTAASATLTTQGSPSVCVK